MEYRKPSVDEAESFWNLMNQLDYETKYMLYEPGERGKNLPRIESLIRDSVEGEDFLLVAQTDNKLVGYISAQKGRLHRIAHSAYIVVGILADYRGKGIGTEFFKRLNVWAEENEVVRLELTVICENEAAKHLYTNSGFRIEGIKQKSVCIDGKYLDEYYMASISRLVTTAFPEAMAPIKTWHWFSSDFTARSTHLRSSGCILMTAGRG